MPSEHTTHPPHRSFVGNPGEFDTLGAGNFLLLFLLGLREQHTLLDVGCGSLRSGRLLIPYLAPDRYFGVEPNTWLVADALKFEVGADVIRLKRPTFSDTSEMDFDVFGVAFDYVHAHSILTHFDLAGLKLFFQSTAQTLKSDGLAVFTYCDGEADSMASGWQYPQTVAYRWTTIRSLSAMHGLTVHRIRWPHSRQTYVAMTHTSYHLAERIDRSPLGDMFEVELW